MLWEQCGEHSQFREGCIQSFLSSYNFTAIPIVAGALLIVLDFYNFIAMVYCN